MSLPRLLPPLLALLLCLQGCSFIDLSDPTTYTTVSETVGLACHYGTYSVLKKSDYPADKTETMILSIQSAINYVEGADPVIEADLYSVMSADTKVIVTKVITITKLYISIDDSKYKDLLLVALNAAKDGATEWLDKLGAQNVARLYGAE
jgi:hypothetical protein